jgi:hypothetical protein
MESPISLEMQTPNQSLTDSPLQNLMDKPLALCSTEELRQRITQIRMLRSSSQSLQAAIKSEVKELQPKAVQKKVADQKLLDEWSNL